MPSWDLPDTHVALAAEPNTAAETRTPSGSSLRAAYSTNAGIASPLFNPTISVDGRADVTVGGEPHVVEHDLVESATRAASAMSTL